MKKQVKNIVQTVKDVVTHAAKTGELIERRSAERLAICGKCPQYDPKGWCKLCGCYLRVKARMAGAKCPLKKWSA